MGRRGRVFATSLVLSAVAAGACVALWNSASVGALSLSSNQGSNLVIGLDPDSRFRCATQVYEPTDWPLTTPAGDAQLASCALGRIRDHPGEWLALAPGKLASHFEPAMIRALQISPASRLPSAESLITPISWGLTALVVGSAIFGGMLMSQRRRNLPLLVASVGAVLAPALLSVLFFGLGRFSYGSLPFLYLLASVGVSGAVDYCRTLRSCMRRPR